MDLYNSNIEKNKGKIPPQAIELERAVIGAMMIDKKGLDEIIDIIFPEIFYKKEHQEIYNVIRKLYDHSKPVDLYTVLDELQKNGKLKLIGGEIYLIELTQKVVSSAHIEYHSRIILQKFLLRKLISISSNVVKKCYDENADVFDLLDNTESKLFDIHQKYLSKKKYETTANLVNKAIDKIKKTKKEGISGISTGFYRLDDITSGWQNSDLIIIASRPGMGKTTFMLSMIRNIAVKQKIPVMIFSLEMSSIQLITKMISSESDISSERIKKANLSKLDWKSLIEKTNNLKNSNLFIDDTPSLSIFNLRAKCRHLISQYGVKLVLVDYMQLMVSNSGIHSENNRLQNREQEISAISRNLKSIAKELDIPIIALSQLSRAVETRGGNKRPLLSDLRESGAIEQDADIVLFIYRPEYYGFNTWDTDDKNDSCIGEAEIIIAKHRNGGLDKFRLKFVSDKSKFENLKTKKYSPLIWEEDYNKNVLKKENKDIFFSSFRSLSNNDEEINFYNDEEDLDKNNL